jgi:hypothetical protein
MSLGSLHRAAGDNKPCHHWVYLRMSCEEYEALRARAGGHCEICGIAEGDTPRGHLVVDHFHGDEKRPETAFIRGMICDKCNNGVMSCIDGLKVWGANRKWEARAREYEANSWDKPTPAALAMLAARKEMLPSPRNPLQPVALRHPAFLEVPLGRGMQPIAQRLRRHLNNQQRERLIELLRG